MDVFKYSRGHFFGTVLPGAFFLINLVIIEPSIFQFIPYQDKMSFKDNQLTLFTVGFVISYVLGVALRLLSPNFLEKIALLIWVPTRGLQKKYFRVFNNKKNDLNYTSRVEFYKEQFPYLKWFYTAYLNESTHQYKQFYDSIKKNFPDNEGIPMPKHFLNYFKTFIYDSSPGLSEDVMFNEGMIRFICGIVYSLLFILLLLLFHLPEMILVFCSYMVIFVIFLVRLRRIRIKEVLSVFDGYMFLKTKSNK